VAQFTEVTAAMADGSPMPPPPSARAAVLARIADTPQDPQVNAGADVKAKNYDGETAWDQTSEKEIEDLLVSFGAVTKEKNPDDMEDHEVPTVEDEPVNP